MVSLFGGGWQRTQQPVNLQPDGAIQILVGATITVGYQQWHTKEAGPCFVIGKEVAVVARDFTMHSHQIFAHLVGLRGAARVDTAAGLIAARALRL